MTFNPGETKKEISISIVDDDMSEPDVVFSVVLVSAEVDFSGMGPTPALEGRGLDSPRLSHTRQRTGSGIRGGFQKGSDDVKILRKRCVVTIVDDDDGGILAFELPTVEVSSLHKCMYTPGPVGYD